MKKEQIIRVIMNYINANMFLTYWKHVPNLLETHF